MFAVYPKVVARFVSSSALAVVTMFLLAIVAAPPQSAGGAEETPAKSDLDKLQGKWRIVTLDLGGQSNSPDATAWIEFTGDRLKSNKENELFKIKLDSTTDPKLIDFERLEGSDSPVSMEGIYSLQDDKLTVCVSVGEGVRVRPTEFAAKEGSGCVLVTLERVKP